MREPNTDLSVKTNSVNNPAWDIAHFRLIVFQPDTDFYALNFKKRLNLLEEKIKAAQDYLEKNSPSAESKSIFVAPEYLFKNFSKSGPERYFTHEQKLKYQEKLIELSKRAKMTIAPGTICWHKE